jgi:hypothetical protein
MFDDPQQAQRGTAHLHQSPRRRARGLGTPADTPAITPHASPERRNRSNSQPQHGWQRSRNVAPATIDVSGGQTRAGRGHPFTVGNVSNGMIYLRYGCFPQKVQKPLTYLLDLWQFMKFYLLWGRT